MKGEKNERFRRCGLSAAQVSINDIISILTKLVHPYIKYQNQFEDFILNLHPHNTWKHGYLAEVSKGQSESDFTRALISNCLSVLRFQKTKDIPFKLGQPDPTILPLKKK